MAKYKKKPVVIDAVKWTGENRQQISDFMGIREVGFLMDMSVVIRTLEGDMKANMGDWIIKGVQGEFYPCKPDIFELTYELVESSK